VHRGVSKYLCVYDTLSAGGGLVAKKYTAFMEAKILLNFFVGSVNLPKRVTPFSRSLLQDLPIAHFLPGL
jgi:hypothetical protein